MIFGRFDHSAINIVRTVTIVVQTVFNRDFVTYFSATSSLYSCIDCIIRRSMFVVSSWRFWSFDSWSFCDSLTSSTDSFTWSIELQMLLNQDSINFEYQSSFVCNIAISSPCVFHISIKQKNVKYYYLIFSTQRSLNTVTFKYFTTEFTKANTIGTMKARSTGSRQATTAWYHAKATAEAFINCRANTLKCFRCRALFSSLQKYWKNCLVFFMV